MLRVCTALSVVGTFAFQTASGIRVSASGNGPPVLFTSGLYGTMPHVAYSSFLSLLRREFTVLKASRPVGASEVDGIAECVGTEQIGVVAHSSILKSMLASRRIYKSVLLDPVVLPAVFGSNACSPSHPCLVVRASRAYDSRYPFIPSAFKLSVEGATEVVEEGMGHSDLLDDFWADAGENAGIKGVRSFQSEEVSFSAWRRAPPASKSVPAKRREYRERIAGCIVDFFREDFTPSATTTIVTDEGEQYVHPSPK